jgi:hypothetical protein
MQMHILSDSQHKELTETLSKLQSILGGSVSVSLDSKPASAPVAKATVAAKPKATSRTRRGRRNILNETKVVTIKSRLEAGESGLPRGRQRDLQHQVRPDLEARLDPAGCNSRLRQRLRRNGNPS